MSEEVFSYRDRRRWRQLMQQAEQEIEDLGLDEDALPDRTYPINRN